MHKKKVIIIGGGAAGFFCAANLSHPHLDITILEKTTKLLSKVRVSGGGRCNVTNGMYDRQSDFAAQYPRGKNILKKSLFHFSYQDTIHWFEKRGVQLKTESDGRIFPVTDDSQTIIDCLTKETGKNNVQIITQCEILQIRQSSQGFTLSAKDGRSFHADFVCMAIGGSAQEKHYNLLKEEINIEPPIPSLFTFNLPGHPISGLMGLSTPLAYVRVQGSRLASEGPLLITHWGLSGPAILKLSAWGAKDLAEMKWNFNININWSGIRDENEVRHIISEYIEDHKNQEIKNAQVFPGIPSRLWQFLVSESGIQPASKLHQAGKKQVNKLISNIVHYECQVRGKTTFKEEFVTAGGYSTLEIDPHHFEAKKCPGLYIIGECLNIDGITGGFNFQNAWTSGYIAAKDILRHISS